jgi:hypothetical protein
MKKEKVKLKKEINEKQEKKRINKKNKDKVVEDEKVCKSKLTVSKDPKQKVLYNVKDIGRGIMGGKMSKATKDKNDKTAEMRRITTVLENSNPIFERVTCFPTIFGQIYKMRYESCFPGLPIQDLKVLKRTLAYVLQLQVAVFLVAKLHHSLNMVSSRCNDKSAIVKHSWKKEATPSEIIKKSKLSYCIAYGDVHSWIWLL